MFLSRWGPQGGLLFAISAMKTGRKQKYGVDNLIFQRECRRRRSSSGFMHGCGGAAVWWRLQGGVEHWLWGEVRQVGQNGWSIMAANAARSQRLCFFGSTARIDETCTSPLVINGMCE